MKTIHLLALALTAGLLAACTKTDAASEPSPRVARTYIVGLSPNLSADDRAKVWQDVGTLVLESAGLGDEIRIFDAVNLREIARFTIPQEKVMAKGPTARARRLQAQFDAFQLFIQEPSTLKDAPPGALLEPQFLDLVTRQVRAPGQPLTVILIGSALYDHPQDKQWNFHPVQYPSDGHLAADPAITPFSTRENPDALAGVLIYHAYLHDEFQDDAYREKVTRWWSLWIASQKGVLAGFAADLPLVIQRATRAEAKPLKVAAVDPSDNQVVMHQPPKSTPAPAASASVQPVPPVATPTPAPATIPSQIAITETNTQVRINLGGDVLFDFDNADIRPAIEPVLVKVVEKIKQYPGATVLIDGYTDCKGLDAYNRDLSNRRALAVKAWLASKGVADSAISAKGCGATNPLAPNTRPDGSDDPEGRRKNRRVEITIEKQTTASTLR